MNRFEHKNEFWFVGFGRSGPYFAPENVEENWAVPLWRELFAIENELPGDVDRSVYLSPCHGRESEFTFYCGFAAERPVSDLPPGMVCFRVPAHTYAVGTVDGGRAAIHDVYATLPKWAEQQGRSVNFAILWLEVYRKRPVLEPQGPFGYEVWLPVASEV